MPRSRKELYSAVGLIEKFSLTKERQGIQPQDSTSSGERIPDFEKRPVISGDVLSSQNVGIVVVLCIQRANATRRQPRRKTGSRTKVANLRTRDLSGFRKIAATPPGTLLWVTLQLTVAKVPAMVDTWCPIFLCSLNVQYLYLTEEPVYVYNVFRYMSVGGREEREGH